MRQGALRGVVALLVVVGVGVGAAGPAGAGGPARKACVGRSVAPMASQQPAPGAYGHLIGFFAKEPDSDHPGLGDAVALLQAGAVPDFVFPNVCN